MQSKRRGTVDFYDAFVSRPAFVFASKPASLFIPPPANLSHVSRRAAKQAGCSLSLTFERLFWECISQSSFLLLLGTEHAWGCLLFVYGTLSA